MSRKDSSSGLASSDGAVAAMAAPSGDEMAGMSLVEEDVTLECTTRVKLVFLLLALLAVVGIGLLIPGAYLFLTAPDPTLPYSIAFNVCPAEAPFEDSTTTTTNSSGSIMCAVVVEAATAATAAAEAAAAAAAAANATAVAAAAAAAATAATAAAAMAEQCSTATTVRSSYYIGYAGRCPPRLLRRDEGTEQEVVVPFNRLVASTPYEPQLLVTHGVLGTVSFGVAIEQAGGEFRQNLLHDTPLSIMQTDEFFVNGGQLWSIVRGGGDAESAAGWYTDAPRSDIMLNDDGKFEAPAWFAGERVVEPSAEACTNATGDGCRYRPLRTLSRHRIPSSLVVSPVSPATWPVSGAKLIMARIELRDNITAHAMGLKPDIMLEWAAAGMSQQAMTGLILLLAGAAIVDMLPAIAYMYVQRRKDQQREQREQVKKEVADLMTEEELALFEKKRFVCC